MPRQLTPRRILVPAIVLVVAVATPGAAGTNEWWRADAVQRDLHLSKEQIARIDQIFRSHLSRRKKRPAREQEALEKRLAAALAAQVLDDDAVSNLVEQVVQVQARRNVPAPACSSRCTGS